MCVQTQGKIDKARLPHGKVCTVDLLAVWIQQTNFRGAGRRLILFPLDIDSVSPCLVYFPPKKLNSTFEELTSTFT